MAEPRRKTRIEERSSEPVGTLLWVLSLVAWFPVLAVSHSLSASIGASATALVLSFVVGHVEARATTALHVITYEYGEGRWRQIESRPALDREVAALPSIRLAWQATLCEFRASGAAAFLTSTMVFTGALAVLAGVGALTVSANLWSVSETVGGLSVLCGLSVGGALVSRTYDHRHRFNPITA